MARDFDGVDDSITFTLAAIDTGDWTIGAWIRPDNAGESNAGRLLITGNQATLFAGAGSVGAFKGFQAFETTDAETVTAETLASGAWSVVFAVYEDTPKQVSIYLGDLDSPMAEAAYASQTTGAGSRLTGTTAGVIGNNAAGAFTWDGRIGPVFLDKRAWSLREMEGFRLGRLPVRTSTMAGLWPLMSPTATAARDESGRAAHGTVTGATAVKNPPRQFVWAQ